MPLNTVNDDLDAAAKQSQALLEQSTASNAQIATALQPARVAICALQDQETSQFNNLASKGPGSQLRDALTAIQDQRTRQFKDLGEQLNVAAGLPASSPQAK
jgi:hypothetical protein